MELNHIAFTPVAAVSFTGPEIETFMTCAAAHYDGRCKEAGAPGGILFGIKNHMITAPGNPHMLDFRELDLLSKIAEVGTSFPRGTTVRVKAAQLRDKIAWIIGELWRHQPSSCVYPKEPA